MGHWPAPSTIFGDGPLMLSKLLELLPPEPEDNPAWILSHPDVAVIGLDAGGVPVLIDRTVFATRFRVGHESNTLEQIGDGFR